MANGLVLDCSVTIRWLLQDGSAEDRAYADRVLDSLKETSAHVPALWYTETIHVLRSYEDHGKLGESALTGFLVCLNRLPIRMDTVTPAMTQLAVAAVAREFRLSGYDAQYLELAKRQSLPIATLDQALRKAARQAGVALYLL